MDKRPFWKDRCEVFHTEILKVHDTIQHGRSLLRPAFLVVIQFYLTGNGNA